MIDSKLVGGLKFPMVAHTITPAHFGELLDRYIKDQPGRIDSTLERRGFIPKEAAKALEITDEMALHHCTHKMGSGKLLVELVKLGVTHGDLVRAGCPMPAQPPMPTPLRPTKGYMVSVSSGRAPVVVHHQLSTADSEADRLARTNPGATVTLLEIVDQRKAVIVPAEYSITKS